jgi:hypothetical protein
MQMYKIMFYGGLVCFIIGFVVSVVLFVRNHVAKILGDISGHNAKKAMKGIQKEREAKEQPVAQNIQESKEKRKNRRFFWKGREEGTDILLNREEKTDMLSETIEKTDVLLKHEEKKDVLLKGEEKTDLLPKQTERAATLLKQAQAVMEDTAEEKSLIPQVEEKEVSGIFQIEEDMTVLGGEVVSELPDTVLTKSVFSKAQQEDMQGVENELLEESELSGESELPEERHTASLILPDGISALDDEETEVLCGEEATSVLVDREVTSILSSGEEPTSVLAGEEATAVLSGGEEPTSVLVGEEATAVLSSGEEPTSVLAGEEMTDVLSSGE